MITVWVIASEKSLRDTPWINRDVIRGGRFTAQIVAPVPRGSAKLPPNTSVSPCLLA